MNWERERVFDLRTVRRHIKAGHISQEEYNKFLGSLEDVSHKIQEPGEGGDDDGFEPAPRAQANNAPAPSPAPAPAAESLDDGWGISSDAPAAPMAPVTPAGPSSDSND